MLFPLKVLEFYLFTDPFRTCYLEDVLARVSIAVKRHYTTASDRTIETQTMMKQQEKTLKSLIFGHYFVSRIFSSRHCNIELTFFLHELTISFFFCSKNSSGPAR